MKKLKNLNNSQMKTYRIKLSLNSGFLTPFHADTLFGHLCWVIAYLEEEKELEKFLKPFKEGNPPFLISDGFPENFLPRPFSAEFNVEDPEMRKEIKKRNFVSLAEFNHIREDKSLEELETIEPSIYEVTTTHNSINRLTYTTFTEGGLYDLEEIIVSYVSIYLKVVSESWKERVTELIEKLSNFGYGRKKSIGKGQFCLKEVEEFEFPEVKNPNGFVTLSNFCPSKNNPTEGLYKVFVKYGKLGEVFTYCGNPFKRPLVMIKTGSVFKTEGKPKHFYGRIVENIAPAAPNVIQYAYAFAVPIIYPEKK